MKFLMELIPSLLNRSCQSWLVKIPPLLVAIAQGNLCSLKILPMKVVATDLIEMGCFMGRKWLYLVNLSTTH
uniref:Uncharacterized protein n=1 Tax=Triticum urartu TaxID=4572 RepID=A0A8R7UG96_TRIUA